MDSLARAAGIGPTVEFLGKTYTVRGRGPGYNAAMEAEICRRRGDPIGLFVEVAKSFSDMKDDASLERLISATGHAVAMHFRSWREASLSEIGDFEQSAYGVAFMVWWGLGGETTDLSVSFVRDTILEAARRHPEELVKFLRDIRGAMDQATGDLGNLTGPRTQPVPGASPAGEQSTAA